MGAELANTEVPWQLLTPTCSRLGVLPGSASATHSLMHLPPEADPDPSGLGEVLGANHPPHLSDVTQGDQCFRTPREALSVPYLV